MKIFTALQHTRFILPPFHPTKSIAALRGRYFSFSQIKSNEYTGLPILDEKGRPKLRDSYLLDTLECGESSFAMACLIANRKYGKNGGREDVKTHHYIVSFDPKDAVENGLTMERAQALGLQFCKENFPGHPAIVCTHPDGHNSAGNIHVHIGIGSLRVRTVERQPFMDKPCDWEAGKKHRCTSAMLRHLRVAVMEMCEQADLNQINLLEAQGDHVSEREYWAQRRGQRRLDHANAKLAAEGQQPTQTVYQTELDKLRKQIYACIRYELPDNFLRKLRLLSIAFHSIHDKNCSIVA